MPEQVVTWTTDTACRPQANQRPQIVQPRHFPHQAKRAYDAAGPSSQRNANQQPSNGKPRAQRAGE